MKRITQCNQASYILHMFELASDYNLGEVQQKGLVLLLTL